METRLFSRDLKQGALALALGGAACLNPFDDGEAPSWMAATVLEADSTTQYTGNGGFHDTRDFSIVSRGTGSSEGEWVIFNRPGEGRASRGEYELGPFGSGDGKFTGFYYRRTLDSVKEKFAVTSGRIRIAKSSADRVTGAFRFTAELFCSTPTGVAQGDSCHPARPIGASPVVVEGSFSVGPPGVVCEDVIRPDGSSC